MNTTNPQGATAGAFLDSLLEKALGSVPLTEGEAIRLLEAPPSWDQAILDAARVMTQEQHGNRATYVVNLNLNFTNVCVLRCQFCGFYRPPGHKEAYTNTVEELIETIRRHPWVTEVCLQGGINPELDFDYYRQALRAIHQEFPALHIHAFSPEEIHFLVAASELPLEAVFEALMKEGLGSIPGTAAEIFDEEIRREIAPWKIGADRWIEIVTTAHRLGIRSSSTILFGHVEDSRAIAHHLATLRHIQDETGGFTELVPLLFTPYRTVLGKKAGIEELAEMRRVHRFYAVARLFLGKSIPNLQTSWVKLGAEEAVKSLYYTCNDVGGTLYQERITLSAGGKHGEGLLPSDLEALVRGAGKEPVQRDTVYNVLDAPVGA